MNGGMEGNPGRQKHDSPWLYGTHQQKTVAFSRQCGCAQQLPVRRAPPSSGSDSPAHTSFILHCLSLPGLCVFLPPCHSPFRLSRLLTIPVAFPYWILLLLPCCRQ